MNQLISIGLMVLILGVVSAEAAVYRWVDEQGRIHFSDRPHKQRPTTEVEVDKINAVKGMDANRRQQQRRMLQIYDEDRQQAGQQKKQQTKVDAKNCKVARHNLANYSRGGVFSKKGPDGERIYMSEAEVSQKQAHWQAMIERVCP